MSYHPELVAGRWFTLSLAEQLGNIGSEVGRMRRSQDQSRNSFQLAFERALELIDLTLADKRHLHRLREITRLRETLCDAVTGGHEYSSSLEGIDRYLMPFALTARLNH